jgi:hypothetical protein
MRLPRLMLVAAVAAGAGAAGAVAAHPKVDPASVPVGFFTAHSQMNDIPVSAVEKVIKSGRADGFLQHMRLAPGEATPFVTHPGPVFAMVAAGAVTNEEPSGGRCRVKTYGPDRGFATRGVRTPHRMTAGSGGAEVYLFFLAPRRTGPTAITVGTPSACR